MGRTRRRCVNLITPGSHETVLDPFDMIAVPKGVYRSFVNITSETAFLLVLITGSEERDYNDIAFPPDESEKFEKTFGAELVHKMEGLGWSFLEKA